MENILAYMLPLIIGVALGALLAWLLMRVKIKATEEKVNGEHQIELARQSERLTASQEENSRLVVINKELEQRVETLRDQLDSARDERAQLHERASRVPELEAAQKGTQEKLESIQQELKEETGRVAALKEQTSRIPELTSALQAADATISTLNGHISELREKVGAAESTAESRLMTINQLKVECDEFKRHKEGLLSQLQQASNQVAELNSSLESERKQSEEKLGLLNDAKEQLSNQFKALASDILEEKSKRFTEQNQTNLSSLLEPLKTRLNEFQGKVEEVYVNEGKDRAALGEQVKHLMTLNQQLSQDAHNLTRALKGQSKAQGNWGELILERVLETSGLTKDIHYHAQQSHTREDGSRAQPDVIIKLPENRNLVVDAKVSLTAYDEYVNAETDIARDAAIKRHLDSMRGHIKNLSGKNYQELYELKSIDFVLMFVPVEPAFMLGISNDSEIWQDAWKQNVLLVSPSTLLFTVRTVAHLWRQEQQTKNAQDIAKRGAELYDKLVGFVEDIESLGSKLQQAQKSYEGAYNKLATGRGNVIRQAEMLKELGIKPVKAISPTLIELALDSDQAIPPSSTSN